MIDFEQYIIIANGVRLYNCTPHPITFLHGSEHVTLPPCGATLPASASEVAFSDPENVFAGMSIHVVSTQFVCTSQGYDEIRAFGQIGKPVLLIGSIISAQAYPASQGHPVAGMVIADPALSRVPPDQRRYSTTKFNAF